MNLTDLNSECILFTVISVCSTWSYPTLPYSLSISSTFRIVTHCTLSERKWQKLSLGRYPLKCPYTYHLDTDMYFWGPSTYPCGTNMHPLDTNGYFMTALRFPGDSFGTYISGSVGLNLFSWFCLRNGLSACIHSWIIRKMEKFGWGFP